MEEDKEVEEVTCSRILQKEIHGKCFYKIVEELNLHAIFPLII